MADLPTGTVTFLLTDIKGRATRWKQHCAAMEVALARHDAILRHAMTGHDGVRWSRAWNAAPKPRHLGQQFIQRGSVPTLSRADIEVCV